MKFLTIAMVLSSTLLASCGVKKTSSKSTSRYSLGTEQGSSSVSSKLNPGIHEYESGCMQDTESGLYRKSSVKIEKNKSETKITLIDSYSHDSSCYVPHLNIELPVVIIHSQTDSLYAGLLGRVYYRPLIEESVDEFKESKFCNRSNWQLNVSTDVTGTQCDHGVAMNRVAVLIENSSIEVAICVQDNSCKSFNLYKK